MSSRAPYRIRANRARRIQGQDDSPLTPEGIDAIVRVAEKLRALPLETARTATFCSPLFRARDTLDRIRGHLVLNGPVRYDPRLMEIDFGRLTGRPVAEVLPLIQTHKAQTDLAYPGGESGRDLRARVLAFLDEVTAAHAGRHLLVMTHFGVIETTLRHLFHIPLSEPVHPPHDAVHRIDLTPNGPPRLEVL